MRFTLLDRDRDRRVRTSGSSPRKQVSLAEEYLGDHFPSFPVLPGVMMLESMVQAARRDAGEPLTARSGWCSAGFGRSNTARMVRPGDTLGCRGHARERPLDDGGVRSAEERGGSDGAATATTATTRQPSRDGLPCGRFDPEKNRDDRPARRCRRPRSGKRSPSSDARTMAMSRDEIFEKVRDWSWRKRSAPTRTRSRPEASLTADLEAESIDFLDIVFRLEKTFSTDGTPFKISQGELFPENLMENAEWVQEGKFTDAGMTMLKERMPHVDFARLRERPGRQQGRRADHGRLDRELRRAQAQRGVGC